jgi:acetyl esterase/lipase
MKSFTIPCVGYHIAADWYDGDKDNSSVLLVLIGYTSSKANQQELVSAIVKKSGTSALVVDYTGHGESPYYLDEIAPAQNFLEVITAYDWVKENHPSKTINVMGTSYGGFMAIQLTKYRSPNKLILRVPAIYSPGLFYTKWKDMDVQEIRHGYRANPENFVKHPLLVRAASYKGHAYVLTHELDESCPKTSTTPIAEAFSAKTWEAKGLKHALSQSTFTKEQIEEYQNKIAEWLR